MGCELCLAPAAASVFTDRRASGFQYIEVCDECIGDAVRRLEGDTGFAEVERWAS